MFNLRSWMILLLAIVGTGCALTSQGRRAELPTAPIAPTTSVQGPRRTDSTSGTLMIGPENTSIRFVGASLKNRQPGSFSNFDEQMELISNNPRDARLSIEIYMDSVVTQIPLLTKHLERVDFFDVDHYPKAMFLSSRVEASTAEGATHMIIGELTLHGVSRDIHVPFSFRTADEQGKPAGYLLGKTALKRLDFGVGQGDYKSTEWVGNDVSVSYSLRLVPAAGH